MPWFLLGRSLPLHPSEVMPRIHGSTLSKLDMCNSLVRCWILGVTGAKNHSVFSQTIRSLWQAAMTRRSTAFQIRLGEVAEGNKPSACAKRKSGGAPIPGFSTMVFAVADEQKKEDVSFYFTVIIHAFTKMDGRAHSCTFTLFSLCLLAGILSS